MAERLAAEDVLLIQDLQVFPVAERGNACWHPGLFVNMLDRCRFTSQPLRNLPLTATAGSPFMQRAALNKLTFDEVQEIVIGQHVKQYEHWKALGTLAPVA